MPVSCQIIYKLYKLICDCELTVFHLQILQIIQEKMINKDILDDLDDLDDDDQNSNQMIEQYESNQDKMMNEGHDIKLQQYGITNINSQKHSRLLTTNRTKFLDHMSRITRKIDQKISKAQTKKEIEQQNKQQMIQQINRSNSYAMEISKQVLSINKYIKSIYNKKIPELQSIVNNQSFYCRAVLQIQQNHKDDQINKDNKRQMFSYLSPHQRISLRISISSPRDPLSKEDQANVIEAAKIVVQLQNHYDALMIYLETCMQIVAPNLCQLVGSAIAAKLIASAGGIDKLAAMPACNIQVMGGNRSSQIGLSQMERNHTGIFGQMEVVKDAPKKFQMQLVRMLATNTAKCARADYLGSNNDQGTRLRQQMYDRFQKIQQQGGLTRTQKPLDIPDQQPKKKRGGKRHRKVKELYQMSELRKQQNRVKFGQAEEEIDMEQGVGLGMLKAGMGKLKVNIKKQKLKVSKKMQQRANKKSGLQSTLNLNANQGIQLINPALKDQRGKNQKILGSQSYFAKQAGFRTILNSKINK